MAANESAVPAGFSFSNLGGVEILSITNMAARRRMEGEELGSVRTVRMGQRGAIGQGVDDLELWASQVRRGDSLSAIR
jgi:hypothetical protein